MAATLTAFKDSGAATGSPPVGTTRATAEGGIVYARNEAGTTVIPIPTATGTHFSWPMWLYLWCSAGGGSTHISNKKLQLATSIATGLHAWFQNVAVATGYTQPAANLAVDSGSNGATPAGYTETISASATAWDASSVAAANAAMASSFAEVGIGVDFLFVGGGGTAALPNLSVIYDESP